MLTYLITGEVRGIHTTSRAETYETIKPSLHSSQYLQPTQELTKVMSEPTVFPVSFSFSVTRDPTVK